MINLNKQRSLIIKPVPPFNFDGTVHNPSHFPTPTEAYKKGKFWQTMRFKNKVVGLKLENQGTTTRPQLELTLFSQKALGKTLVDQLVEEIKYRFELDFDLTEFNQKFKNDKILGPAIKRWRGMRSKCGYSLYESLMIYIVLQNATVRRTVQMMNALLEKYGRKVKFDGQELFSFWSSQRLDKASEQELRDLKVGYRAKFFKRISADFVQGKFEEKTMRQLSNEQLKEKLIELYGIGPASLDYLLSDFHRHDAFDILPPWEQKIYSRLLYQKALVDKEKILKSINRRWGRWKKLAAHYVWTDLFWRHKQKSIPWLAKEIRL